MRDGNGSKLLESEKIVYGAARVREGPNGVLRGGEAVRAGGLASGLDGDAGEIRWVRDGDKAVLDDGNVVAVKRLKDANVRVKREFKQHMEFWVGSAHEGRRRKKKKEREVGCA